jgi:hypothetical protein
MEPTEKITPPGEKGRHHVRAITVMIIRGVGKVQSFKISPRIVLWAAIFFLIYISASIFIINKHFDLHRTHLTQSERITQLKRQISNSKQNIHRFEQHIAVLRDHIDLLEKSGEHQEATVKSEYLQHKGTVRSVLEPSKDREKRGDSTNVVDVKDMVIQRQESRMTVDFKLVNTRPGENVVGGYLHIIAVGKDPNPPPEWTHPKEKIQNGLPLNFRRGQLFLIRRFKPIHTKFSLTSTSEPPTAVKVLVYDRSGVLILEKEFEVSNAS